MGESVVGWDPPYACYAYMSDVMRRLEWDLHNTIAMTSRIPDAWHEIASRETVSRKVRVSFWIETDVLRFLKSMGEGWGPRANDVLKAWMEARLAGVIRGAETLEIWRRRQEEFAGPKPRFGETARMLGEEDETTAAQPGRSRAALRERLQARVMEEGGVKGAWPRVPE